MEFRAEDYKKNKLAVLFTNKADLDGASGKELLKNEVIPPTSLSSDGKVLDVYIYDVIYDTHRPEYGGYNILDLCKTIRSTNASTINLYVNSPGGDIFDARAIQSALRDSSATVNAQVDGLAASAASFLLAGADSIKMSDGSFLMIHCGWTFAIGNAKDLGKTVKLLQSLDKAIAKDYATITGKSEKEILKMMEEETWLEANEAVEAGFAQEVLEKRAEIQSFDLSIFEHAPESLTISKDSASIEEKNNEQELQKQAQEHRQKLNLRLQTFNF